jgi:hypothetical protein
MLVFYEQQPHFSVKVRLWICSTSQAWPESKDEKKMRHTPLTGRDSNDRGRSRFQVDLHARERRTKLVELFVDC